MVHDSRGEMKRDACIGGSAVSGDIALLAPLIGHDDEWPGLHGHTRAPPTHVPRGSAQSRSRNTMKLTPEALHAARSPPRDARQSVPAP